MKTTFFCFFFLLLTGLSGYSQDADVTKVVKLTVINPGASYENRIGKLQTLFVQPFIKSSIHAEPENIIVFPFRTHTTYYFDPAVTAQFRQYYLTKKQRRSAKAHSLNSMNYLALYEELFFSKRPIYQNVTSRRGYNKLAIVWGLQRNLPDHFSVNFHVGYAYTFPLKPFYDLSGQKPDETLNESLLVQLNLGFWLNGKRKNRLL